MTGPRSEPPIPMLTTVRIGLPVAPSQRPERRSSEKTRIFSKTALTAGMTSTPSTSTGVFERLRSAVWSTARPSVQLIRPAGKHGLGGVLDPGIPREPDQHSDGLGGDDVLRVVEEDRTEIDREPLESLRIGIEEVSHLGLAQPAVVIGERGPRRSLLERSAIPDPAIIGRVKTHQSAPFLLLPSAATRDRHQSSEAAHARARAGSSAMSSESRSAGTRPRAVY